MGCCSFCCCCCYCVCSTCFVNYCWWSKLALFIDCLFFYIFALTRESGCCSVGGVRFMLCVYGFFFFVSSRRKETRFYYLLYLKKAVSCCKSLFLRHVVHLCCYIFVLFSGKDVWVNCLLVRLEKILFATTKTCSFLFAILAVPFNMFGLLCQVRIVFFFLFR